MSFLDTAKRAFGSKTDDYYDDRYEEYDDEYEDYEEEPKKNLFSFLRRNDEDEYDDYDEDEVAPKRKSSYSYSVGERLSSRRQKSSATESASKAELTVHYPTSFDDATRIIRDVKADKITIFDISGITSDDEARRVVDYIGGAAFGMECPFERLCPSIFCIAPVGVKIDAKRTRY